MNKISFFLIIVVSFFSKPVVMADSVIKPFIFGGIDVRSDDPIAQQTVLIQGKIGRGSFTCTGVVFNQQMILTAGHCLGGPGYAELTVLFRLNKNGSGPIYKVIDQVRPWAQMPVSGSKDWDDVALLKLEKQIPPNYQPVKMVMDLSLIQNGQTVILAGYGQNVTDDQSVGRNGLGVLRKVEQVILDKNYGQREMLVNIEGRGSCFGDSGGPAFVLEQGELRLLGITSRLSPNDKVIRDGKESYLCLKDIIYGLVPDHKEWLDKTAANL